MEANKFFWEPDFKLDHERALSPADTGPKLNKNKTFRRRPTSSERLM